MCIRDRNDPDIERIVRTLPNADEIFHVRDKMSKRVQETMNEDCAVSYTHLDVYKRQSVGCVNS